MKGRGGGLRLGGARADFVAGLGRKVSDLRGCLRGVRDEMGDISRREELRRKLHALGSAAKLMKFDAMERALAEAVGSIDRADVDAPLDAADVDAIDHVIEDLPALAWGEGEGRVSRIEPVAKPPEPTFAALVVGSALIAEALLDEPPPPANVTGDPPADAAANESTDEQPAPAQQRQRLRFSCESTPDAQAAFDLARSTEPDLIVLDADVDDASELVEALMDDPLTERAPVVVIGSFLEAGEAARYIAMGVAKTVSKPTSKLSLRDACEAALEAQRTRSDGIAPTFASTEAAPEIDLPHGDRFRTRLRGPAAEVRVEDRKIVVADDDPAVAWFLADLLKTSGCTVYEAFDGKKALELAYRTSPDLVLFDIMMPGLDGFSLCRTLRRDVALRDVPVVLLSWKEDLLQRVRELGAGAAGYVRKESDTRAIMARIREALRPRARIELRLRNGGEVRGRMDGVSVRSLLEMVCASRPDARVCVRDASFSYEVEIRGGVLVRATRTAGDGSVLRGSRVLAPMLGVGAGRFTVTTSVGPVEVDDLEGNLTEQLARPLSRARAAIMLLTGEGRAKSSRLVLDEDALGDYLRAMPELVRQLALRLADGTPPLRLVLEGACDAALMDDLVCDLAARGVVVRVEDEAGVDLLEAAAARLAELADPNAPSPSDAMRAKATSCEGDAPMALCKSPSPGEVDGKRDPASEIEGASLEDAVMREVALRSPAPAQLGLPLDVPKREVSETRAPYEPEQTPPHDQIVALAEATIIDGTSYGERPHAEEDAPDVSIPIIESSRPVVDSRATATSLSAVRREEVAGLPRARRSWPLIALIASMGLLAYAVAHFSTESTPEERGGGETTPTAQDVAKR